MAKHQDFIFSIAKLCGDPKHARRDLRNRLIYGEELKGDSPFNRTEEDRLDPYGRLEVFFDGITDSDVKFYCMDLTRLIELYHYKHAHKLDADEELEIIELKASLIRDEQYYPDVAKVLAVDEVEASVASTATKSQW